MANKVQVIREKYAKTPYGHDGRLRYPAGGEDVLALCALVGRYREIIEWAERQLPSELANDLRNKLWCAEQGVAVWPYPSHYRLQPA